MKKILLLILLIIFALSCSTDDIIEAEPQLVVEGWIDAGGYPVVILTTTVPIKRGYQSFDSLNDCLVKYARVTVSDGENEVILTGRADSDYYPPYIYTTSQMKGVAGNRYSLLVEYGDFVAGAETTIPEPVELDSLVITPVDDNEKYSITAHFTDDASEKNYYKFFAFASNDLPTGSVPYSSSYMGLVDDNGATSNIRVPVYRGRSLEHWEDYDPYFAYNENVKIKFAHIDSVSYDFWKDYEEMLSLSRNPFFSLKENIHSNIKGGLGYWCGYGSAEYLISY